MRIIFLLLLAGCLASPALGLSDPSEYHAFSRLDFYTEEEYGEIAVFIPLEKKDLSITIDLVFEFQFLTRSYQVVAHGFSGVPFDMQLLREGANEVTVSFNEDGKWVDSRKVTVMVRKPSATDVKLDCLTGLPIHKGLPLVPVGGESEVRGNPLLLDQMALEGLNLAATEPASVAKACGMRTKGFLDRCDARGIVVLWDLSAILSEAGGSGALVRKRLDNEVGKIAGHPALLAWGLHADSVGKGIAPDSLRAFYQQLKKIDPVHPVAVWHQTPRDALNYAGCSDIVILRNLSDRNGLPDRASLMLLDLAGIAVWTAPGPEYDLEITPGVYSNQNLLLRAYSDLCLGATGFLRAGSRSGWVSTFPADLIRLTPSLASGHPVPPLTADNPDLLTRVLNLNGLFTLIVTNPGSSTLDFSLQMDEIDLTIDAETPWDGRKVKMRDGKLTDVIFGGSQRMYLLDNRMKPDVRKYINPSNLTLDPGFETFTGIGKPQHVQLINNPGNGSTWFVDGRVSRQGDRSLRLTTSRKARGAVVALDTQKLPDGKTYTVSVWAGSLRSDPGQKFQISLGEKARKEFELSDEWKEYSFTVSPDDLAPDENGRIRPKISLLTRGTAWFDVLQVY